MTYPGPATTHYLSKPAKLRFSDGVEFEGRIHNYRPELGGMVFLPKYEFTRLDGSKVVGVWTGLVFEAHNDREIAAGGYRRKARQVKAGGYDGPEVWTEDSPGKPLIELAAGPEVKP